MPNKFVSFLKRAGQVLQTGLPIAATYFPILSPFLNLVIPQKLRESAVRIETIVQSEIALLSKAVFDAEIMGNALTDKGITGPDKARAAAIGIMQLFLTSESMAGKEIADPEAAQKATITIAGGIADFWNAVDGKHLPG